MASALRARQRHWVLGLCGTAKLNDGHMKEAYLKGGHVKERLRALGLGGIRREVLEQLGVGVDTSLAVVRVAAALSLYGAGGPLYRLSTPLLLSSRAPPTSAS